MPSPAAQLVGFVLDNVNVGADGSVNPIELGSVVEHPPIVIVILS